MPQRKLARVLPEPVGAQISVLAPPAIAFQPPAWAGVGPSKEASNQRRTAGAERGQRIGSRALARVRAQPIDLTQSAAPTSKSERGAGYSSAQLGGACVTTGAAAVAVAVAAGTAISTLACSSASIITGPRPRWPKRKPMLW